MLHTTVIEWAELLPLLSSATMRKAFPRSEQASSLQIFFIFFAAVENSQVSLFIDTPEEDV